jgi:hypothetical protein
MLAFLELVKQLLIPRMGREGLRRKLRYKAYGSKIHLGGPNSGGGKRLLTPSARWLLWPKREDPWGGRMVQHATAAVSIASSILLCLVFIGLVYDVIAGYSARRRFAKLLSLKKFWLRERSRATAAPAHKP